VTYQTVRVAGDGSCLAASYTPAGEIREATYALYPPEFRDWVAQSGVPQPPTQFCPPPAPVADAAVAQLNMPTATGVITGAQVLLSGTARGSYVLDVGAGPDPSDWQLISQGTAPIQGGLIGIWSAGALPPGPYTLRLRVTTPEGVIVNATQTVTLAR
jgi:hypothetical protein